MSTPHDHHFVPAFYLNQWCDPNTNKLVEYSIPYGRKVVSKPVGPKATGFERDLYAFSELPPDQAQWMEQKFFDYADRNASQALDLLLADHPKSLWSDELLSAWARFLVGIHVRHPDVLPELKAHAKAVLETGVDESYEEIRKPGDPPTFTDWVAANDPMTPYRFTLELVMGAMDNEFIGVHMMEMHWGVVNVSATPRRFVTSDRPVAFYYCKQPNGSITMPISPTKLFVAVNDPQRLDKARLTKPRELVDGINKDNIRRARRYVWAMNEPRWQGDLIREHMSRQMEKLPLLPLLARHNIAAKSQTASPLG